MLSEMCQYGWITELEVTWLVALLVENQSNDNKDMQNKHIGT